MPLYSAEVVVEGGVERESAGGRREPDVGQTSEVVAAGDRRAERHDLRATAQRHVSSLLPLVGVLKVSVAVQPAALELNVADMNMNTCN